MTAILDAIFYAGILVVLLDTMDAMSFYRLRDNGYFSIHREPDVIILGYELRFDAWHTVKIILILYILYMRYGLGWELVAGYLTTFIGHEHIFFKFLFKGFINNGSDK